MAVQRFALRFVTNLQQGRDRRVGVEPHLRDMSRRTSAEEAIETELRRLIDQFGRWPTVRELRSEGLYGLYCAISASKRGREGWARGVGVQAKGAGWSDDRIETALRV
jgi:hypothetical protein